MAEWLIEDGIAEQRAIRLENGRIVAARLHWPGRLTAGQVEDAVLTTRRGGTARGTARFASGEEALVDRLPRDASEGSAIRLEITRPAMREAGRRKLAQARPTTADPTPAPSLAKQIEDEGHAARIVRRFPDDADWDELWLEAWHGAVEFAGGSLGFFPTPAMTLVDVDGADDPAALARQSAGPLARAIERFDLGGSIGIDFPTLATKADRKAVDAALAEALDGWPHEATAMNGFGFVQLVARSARPSLLHRIGGERPAAAARHLLRRAEVLHGPGTLQLSAHPALTAHLTQPRLDELARRAGCAVALQPDPSLALEAGHAQIVGDG